ncbi:MAG: IPExxxVDY family protein [Chryseobacterium sp.]|nr:MAG: IPExxxVDY family protein [Chryseobacterium sp.]
MLKAKTFLLEDDDDEPMLIGLIRLVRKLPLHEIFFELNKHNPFVFRRAKDFITTSFAGETAHAVFKAYDESSDTDFTMISNLSFETSLSAPADNLFGSYTVVSHILRAHHDVDFLLIVKDSIPDFSLILLPDNLCFQIQPYRLDPDLELYKQILYYE